LQPKEMSVCANRVLFRLVELETKLYYLRSYDPRGSRLVSDGTRISPSPVMDEFRGQELTSQRCWLFAVLSAGLVPFVSNPALAGDS